MSIYGNNCLITSILLPSVKQAFNPREPTSELEKSLAAEE